MARGSGRMGITELLVGVPFPALAFEIVRFAVPGRYLPEFTYTGATYDVDASLARGWVDELVDANALTERAHRRAREGAAIAQAFTQAKKQLRQEVSERVERGGVTTDQAVTDIWTEALGYIRDYVARTLNKS
jgi:enoyl-CoA hydratase